MIPLGTVAPSFSLPDAVSGKLVSLDLLRSDKATVVMFICNHCPFVKHIRAELAKLAQDYQPKGISFIAISSNDAVQRLTAQDISFHISMMRPKKSQKLTTRRAHRIFTSLTAI
jgi:thiol-disulfide isomerase/thioredoxin